MKPSLFFFFLCLTVISSAQDSLSIFFDFDSYKLNSEAKEQLKLITGKTIVSVFGYADSRGSYRYNKKLAQKRIHSTLKHLGISPVSKVESNNIGEEKLLSTLHSENRKVVVYFYQNSSLPSNFSDEKETISDNGIGDQIDKAKIGEKVKLKSLNFQPGLDVLLPSAIPTLQELLKVMQSNKNLIIQIEGHICCASADFADLSTSRAYRVYEYLLNNGIQYERISYVGYGVTQPLHSIPEKSIEEEIANRRVEIKIISN